MKTKTMATELETTGLALKGRAGKLAQIRQLERDILKSVPYDNWSAGDGVAPKSQKTRAQ